MDNNGQITALLNNVGLVTGGGGFNWTNLIGGLIFGTIGFAAFMYGKKQSAFKPLGIGIALMVYPYFVPDTLLLYVIGIALTVALFIWRD